MDIGDIVRRGEGELGILISKVPTTNGNPDGPEAPRFLCNVLYESGVDSQGTLHIYWLQLVHTLNTPEAREIHSRYPQHEGHDWHWYMQERGLIVGEVEVALEDSVTRPFHAGDRVRIVGRGDGHDGIETTIISVRGSICSVEPVAAPDIDGGSTHTAYNVRFLELVPQVGTEIQPVILPPSQWRVGDIVECVAPQGTATGRVITEGMRVTIASQTGAGGIRSAIMEDGHVTSEVLHNHAFRFVERPVAAPTTHRDWVAGDILRRHLDDNGRAYPYVPNGSEVTYVDHYNNNIVNVRAGNGEIYAMNASRFEWVSRPLETTVEEQAAPVVIPTNSNEWLPGDILELTRTQQTHNYSDPDHRLNRTIEIGTRVRIVRSLGDGGGGFYVSSEDGVETYPAAFYAPSMRWVSRPSAEVITESMPTNLSPLAATQWLAGDIVRRVSGEFWLSECAIGSLVTVTTAPGVTRLHNQRQPQNFSWRNESGRTGNHHSDDYEFITREGIVVANRLLNVNLPTIPPIEGIGAIPPDQWMEGDILRRERATEETRRFAVGQEAAIVAAPRPGSRMVTVDVPGYGSYNIPKGDCIFVRRAERAFPWPLNVDVSGTTKEERTAFESALKELGLVKHSGDYGVYERSPARGNNLLLVGYSQRDYLYYDGSLGGASIGRLLDVWNKVLAVAASKNLQKKAVAAPKVKPARKLSLFQLPAYAVVESQRESQSVEQRNANLASVGFPTDAGKYMLLAKGKVTWTDSVGVAKAFQELNSCVWLGTEDDKQEFINAFNKRKLMLSKTAAQQRFALDVPASGGPLIAAFKAFMAFSGYRQLNPELTDGPFILVNYGPTTKDGKADFATFPLTWQYASTYYKRSKLMDLSQDKGWEWMVDRISSDGVVRPIEQADELDATPQKGDCVVLINVAVTEGLPETEADLAFHAAGKTYTVAGFIKELVQIKETGMLLHPDRLGVVAKPRGISSGDAVVVTDNYGELVKKDELYTFMEDGKSKFGVLVNGKGDTYQVPPSHYRVATEAENKAFLLKNYGITIPVKVKIINPHALGYGEEVTITTCWPLTNKRLAFWTEEGTDLSAWYEREDFQVVTDTVVNDNPIKILKGATETQIQVGDTIYSAKALETALAMAYN